MSERAATPFSRAGVLALVTFGLGVLFAILYFIAMGDSSLEDQQNGRAHALSNALNGYSALARLVEADGMDVTLSRSQGSLETESLLVLTPPHYMDPEELTALIDKREYIGPTLVILPKWSAIETNMLLQMETEEDVQDGWVLIGDMTIPDWTDVQAGMLALGLKRGGMPGIDADGFSIEQQIMGEPVPDTGDASPATDEAITRNPQSFTTLYPLDEMRGSLPTAIGYYVEPDISREPLVLDQAGRIIAFSYEREDYYNSIEDRNSEDYSASNWVVFVIEPDLMNNWGLADETRALAALSLVRTMNWGDYEGVVFDLTMNGFGSNVNLLTLAFQPPFLAATICLLLAMLMIGWRAFLRFGPSAALARETAFGKARLVANGADLIVRAGRLRLLAEPYIALSARRAARSLALPRAEQGAIDKALAIRTPDAPSFTQRAEELRAATKPADILRAARALNDQTRRLPGRS